MALWNRFIGEILHIRDLRVSLIGLGSTTVNDGGQLRTTLQNYSALRPTSCLVSTQISFFGNAVEWNDIDTTANEAHYSMKK